MFQRCVVADAAALSDLPEYAMRCYTIFLDILYSPTYDYVQSACAERRALLSGRRAQYYFQAVLRLMRLVVSVVVTLTTCGTEACACTRRTR